MPGTTESRDEQAAVDYELEVEMYENQRIGKECDRQIMTLASAKNNQNLAGKHHTSLNFADRLRKTQVRID